MLYPKISNIKRNNTIIRGMLILSIVVSILLMLINYLTNPELHWSFLTIAGIIYIWITTIYSIKKNVNIASHVMLQMLCTSILLIGIDYILGYQGWSMIMGMPIIIIVANLSMVVLALVSRKKYAQYSLYQIIIGIFTIIMLCLIPLGIAKLNTLYIIAAGVSSISLILSISLCGREIINQIHKTFHM